MFTKDLKYFRSHITILIASVIVLKRKFIMQMIAINTDSALVKLEVEISHKGETITWNISSFDRDSFNVFDVFEQINNYWSQFTIDEQNKIFSIYKKIRVAFDDIWDRQKLSAELYVLVAELLDTHDLNDVHHWVLYHSGVYFSDDFDLEYKNISGSPGSREQTYLREDYTKLVSLSLVLRLMVPIWGEFICRTRQEHGTMFKEYCAFQLICKSKLAYSDSMNKLTTYIEYSIGNEKSKSASIIGGISTEDFPIWLLGLVLVRRLCVGDIRGINPKSHLITIIYKFITSKIKGNDNNFAGIVKDKIFEESSSDGDANISKLEGYKAKQEIPAGDIVLLEYIMKDLEPLAVKLAPSIDMNLLYKALETTKVLNNTIIYDPQIILLQWVLKPIISPRGVMFLSKNTIIRALALCQSVLIHRGHFALAGLVTATVNMNHDDIQVSGVDSRARIPRELLDELAILYPFTKRTGGKQKPLKPINQAVISIDHMDELLTENDWFLTIEDKFLSAVTEGSSNRRYTIPHNIKIKLANLVIELGKRNYKL